jgi:hypothetical protein
MDAKWERKKRDAISEKRKAMDGLSLARVGYGMRHSSVQFVPGYGRIIGPKASEKGNEAMLYDGGEAMRLSANKGMRRREEIE